MIDQLFYEEKLKKRWFVIIPVYLPLFSLDLLERFENKEFKFLQEIEIDDILMSCYDSFGIKRNRKKKKKKSRKKRSRERFRKEIKIQQKKKKQIIQDNVHFFQRLNNSDLR